ncbi:hypothetical protein VTL71DRAFT_6731 [Oculimacula yallundae]|uniref:2EXR domain-containing protein n=1 Tax=Oculimacula yallundae TaxID=86028 RepID=A0ABR4BXX7_9HELO
MSTVAEIPDVTWAQLPNEITIMIWELAFSTREGRLIHLTLPNRSAEAEDHMEVPHSQRRKGLRLSSLVSPSPVPAVCRQSRFAALKASRLETGEASLMRPRNWYSPEIDTVFLDDALMRGLLLGNDLGIFSRCDMALSRIQKLAIVKPFDSLDHIHLTYLLYFFFRDLKLVQLVQQSYTPDDVSNLVMMEHHDIDELTHFYSHLPGTPEDKTLVENLDRLVQFEAQQHRADIRLPVQRDGNGDVYEGPNPIRFLLATVTTPERRDEFYKARTQFYTD